jgi:hypothetical protein
MCHQKEATVVIGIFDHQYEVRYVSNFKHIYIFLMKKKLDFYVLESFLRWKTLLNNDLQDIRIVPFSSHHYFFLLTCFLSKHFIGNDYWLIKKWSCFHRAIITLFVFILWFFIASLFACADFISKYFDKESFNNLSSTKICQAIQVS